MKVFSHVLFWLALLCIPFSWVMWYVGGEVEIRSHLQPPFFDAVADPGLRRALAEAHAERWGIFVGLWPVTLLVLSYIVEKKSR